MVDRPFGDGRRMHRLQKGMRSALGIVEVSKPAGKDE